MQQKIGGEEGYLAALEIRTREESTVDLPDALDANASQDEITIRNVEVQGVGKLRSKLKGARKSAFSILYDQCSQEVKDKLRSGQGWDVVECEQTTYNLITRIRKIVTGFEEHKQGSYNLVQSMRRLFLHIQGESESVADYIRHFKGLWNTAEAFGASPGLHMGHLASWMQQADWIADPANLTNAESERARMESQEAIAASLLVGGANRAKFGELKRSLANEYLKGNDNYPTTMEDARNLLENYEPERKPNPQPQFYHDGGGGDDPT